eukprot:3231169-Amphidinium_carterae.1
MRPPLTEASNEESGRSMASLGPKYDGQPRTKAALLALHAAGAALKEVRNKFTSLTQVKPSRVKTTSKPKWRTARRNH